MMSAAAQMFCGGLSLGVIALIRGEHIAAMPSTHAIFAMIYLIVFGSLLGFSAYIYLLANTRPALAASYAYVNPPVAVLIGVLIAGESVTQPRHRRHGHHPDRRRRDHAREEIAPRLFGFGRMRF